LLEKKQKQVEYYLYLNLCDHNIKKIIIMFQMHSCSNVDFIFI